MPEQPMDVEDDLVAMLNERQSLLQSREDQPASENHGAEQTSSPSTDRRPRFEEGQVVTLQRSYGAAVRGCVGTVLFYAEDTEGPEGFCEVLFYDILEAGKDNPNDIPNLPSLSEMVSDDDLRFAQKRRLGSRLG